MGPRVLRWKRIRIAPGDRLTLDVDRSLPTHCGREYPMLIPQVQGHFQDAPDWRNPYLIIQVDGIVVLGSKGKARSDVESIPATLESLPDLRGPYGLVVAVQESGLRSSGADDNRRIEANRASLLSNSSTDCRVLVNSWPSALSFRTHREPGVSSKTVFCPNNRLGRKFRERSRHGRAQTVGKVVGKVRAQVALDSRHAETVL